MTLLALSRIFTSSSSVCFLTSSLMDFSFSLPKGLKPTKRKETSLVDEAAVAEAFGDGSRLSSSLSLSCPSPDFWEATSSSSPSTLPSVFPLMMKHQKNSQS
eukprot:s2119_g11.t1